MSLQTGNADSKLTTQALAAPSTRRHFLSYTTRIRFPSASLVILSNLDISSYRHQLLNLQTPNHYLASRSSLTVDLPCCDVSPCDFHLLMTILCTKTASILFEKIFGCIGCRSSTLQMIVAHALDSLPWIDCSWTLRTGNLALITTHSLE